MNYIQERTPQNKVKTHVYTVTRHILIQWVIFVSVVTGLASQALHLHIHMYQNLIQVKLLVSECCYLRSITVCAL